MLNFDEILSEFRDNFQEMKKHADVQKFYKIVRTFLKFPKHIFFIQFIISFAFSKTMHTVQHMAGSSAGLAYQHAA